MSFSGSWFLIDRDRANKRQLIDFQVQRLPGVTLAAEYLEQMLCRPFLKGGGGAKEVRGAIVNPE
jgi:hypothetical protein